MINHKTHPSEYKAWGNAKSRCNNRNDSSYKNYGGRGIKFHPAWENDFAAFLNHIGPKPSRELSLDRIDNNGNYEPGNVKWSSAIEQSNNRRTRRAVAKGYKFDCRDFGDSISELNVTLIRQMHESGLKLKWIAVEYNFDIVTIRRVVAKKTSWVFE